jgi:hypothetical protein
MGLPGMTRLPNSSLSFSTRSCRFTLRSRGGLVTVEEVQKAVDIEHFRLKFTHDDPELNGKYRRYVQRMVENAYREARNGKKFEY